MYRDGNELRKIIEDYYLGAMFNGYPPALIDLEKIEDASDEELEPIAKKIGINVDEKSHRKKYSKIF